MTKAQKTQSPIIEADSALPAVIDAAELVATLDHDGTALIKRAIEEGYSFARVVKLGFGEGVRGTFLGLTESDSKPDERTGEVKRYTWIRIQVTDALELRLLGAHETLAELRARATPGDKVVIIKEGERELPGGRRVHSYFVGVQQHTPQATVA